MGNVYCEQHNGGKYIMVAEMDGDVEVSVFDPESSTEVGFKMSDGQALGLACAISALVYDRQNGRPRR